jgi:hypothetical protein
MTDEMPGAWAAGGGFCHTEIRGIADRRGFSDEDNEMIGCNGRALSQPA